MLLLQFVWLCFSAEAQGGNYLEWVYSSASSPVLLPFGDLQLKVKNPLLLCLIITLALLLKMYILCQSYARGSGENFHFSGFLQVMEKLESQRSSFARPG